MKTAPLASLVLLLLTTSVLAQETAESADLPPLKVLNKSWSKQVLPLGPNPNPLAPNEELIRQTRIEKDAIRMRDYGLPKQTVQEKAPSSSSPMARLDTYVYKIKVQNTGQKTIKSFEWEYQLLNPTQQVMGQERMTSKVKIAPGKTQEVKNPSTRQSTILVFASQLDKKYRDQFTERVIIHRVDYTDGTVWQRP